MVPAASGRAACPRRPCAGLILDGLHDTVDPAGVARSDNYYGWAKIAYENLGFMFATGEFGQGGGVIPR